MRRRRCLPRFTFSCSNYHQVNQHSCLQVGKKFSDMQTAIGRRSKEKALKVVKAQQQVSMLEAEVEEMERRREIKLEQGEAMHPFISAPETIELFHFRRGPEESESVAGSC